MKRSTKIVIVVITLLLLIDQISKIWIKTNMSLGESIMVFGDWFQIKFIENKGAAYGFEFGGEFGKLGLSLIRIFLIGFIIYYIRQLLKRGERISLIIGITLILCGAIGNLIDSLLYGVIFSESTVWQVAQFVPIGEGYSTWLHGSVVDMLYFPIIDTTLPEWLPWVGGTDYIFFSPIFNCADSYISVGVVYLILFHRKELFSK